MPCGLLRNKKSAPVPPWDKSVLLLRYHPNWRLSTPTRFTRHHACPVDNGWGPVGIYWGIVCPTPFKPPSEVHSPTASDPASTVRDSLCLGRAGYFSSSQVLLYCGLLYAPERRLSRGKFPPHMGRRFLLRRSRSHAKRFSRPASVLGSK